MHCKIKLNDAKWYGEYALCALHYFIIILSFVINVMSIHLNALLISLYCNNSVGMKRKVPRKVLWKKGTLNTLRHNQFIKQLKLILFFYVPSLSLSLHVVLYEIDSLEMKIGITTTSINGLCNRSYA